MNLNGKILVFINGFENQGNLARTYKTTISNKDKDGNYQNMSIDVKFAGTKFTSENLANLMTTLHTNLMYQLPFYLADNTQTKKERTFVFQ